MVGLEGRLRQRLVRLERAQPERGPMDGFPERVSLAIQRFGVPAVREVAHLLGVGQTSDLLEDVVRFTFEIDPGEPLPAFLDGFTPAGP